MIPLILLATENAVTGISMGEILNLIAILTSLGSVGGVVFSAGVIRAQITQNKTGLELLTTELKEIKAKAEAEKDKKAENIVSEERRLSGIESKIDTVITLMSVFAGENVKPKLENSKLPTN